MGPRLSGQQIVRVCAGSGRLTRYSERDLLPSPAITRLPIMSDIAPQRAGVATVWLVIRRHGDISLIWITSGLATIHSGRSVHVER